MSSLSGSANTRRTVATVDTSSVSSARGHVATGPQCIEVRVERCPIAHRPAEHRASHLELVDVERDSAPFTRGRVVHLSRRRLGEDEVCLGRGQVHPHGVARSCEIPKRHGSADRRANLLGMQPSDAWHVDVD